MIPLALPSRVLVRSVPASYTACLRSDPRAEPDLLTAHRQHAAYVEAIRALGVVVVAVPPDDASPDACFVEDAAVVTGAHAVATRPGAPSRRAEVVPVARALADVCIVHAMEPPATLDGGDVLRVGATLFVGLSARTNADGAAFLAEVAARDGLATCVIPVATGLHLKSACTLADAATLLYAPALLDEAALALFRASGLACVQAPEPIGANVLALGDRVLVSAAAPATAALLEARGHAVVPVDVAEFHKGDGALTCLSIRIPPPGGVCT
jgi:dimethylargininase